VLSTVHKDSPAEKAGLKDEDQLIRFGTAKVTNFDALTELISHLDAGDEVEIEVQREVEDEQGGYRLKKVVTKVTLGPWGVEPAVLNGWRP
jgi:S1-C subfamily serine protease